MHRLRRLVLVTAATALVATALAVPASAADTTGTLAIVNGRPGAKVDICIAGKEQASAVPYGGVYRKGVIGTGIKVLKFYKADRRTCRGTLFGSYTLNIAAGTDLTVVLTRIAPKVVIFDNANMGEIPPRGTEYINAYFGFRHAAEMPANWIHSYYAKDGDFPWTPTANAVWTKGDAYQGPFVTGAFFIQTAIEPEDPTAVLGKAFVYTQPSRRYEFVLVGTNALNAKMVKIDRGISNPSP